MSRTALILFAVLAGASVAAAEADPPPAAAACRSRKWVSSIRR